MRLDLWKRSLQNKYSQLLVTIIGIFLVAPAFSGTTGQIVISAVFISTIIAIIRTFNLKKREFLLLLTLAGASFILDIHNTLRVNVVTNQVFVIAVEIIYSLFILTALVTINRKLFSEKKVSGDTIKGGIAVFFLIGIFWALLYHIVYILDPRAFSQPVEATDFLDSMFYFSFTTLTTLGYGDIFPVSDLARSLASLEAIIGVMYPAIYIARVVGLYTAQELSKHD